MSKEKRRVPKLRFPGFTEDWEQCKLTDIAKTFIGLVTTMTENYRDSGTLLIRNSDIKEGQFIFSEKPIHLDEEFAEKNKTRRLQIGDVVTVHTGDIGTSAVIEEKEDGAIGFATINTRTDQRILNPYFLSTYFNTEKHKCYANSVSTGDGRSNYNIKDFNKLVISIPTLDEQERISLLINNINTIITLHQRKLNNLKLKKKALLQKLFPKNGERYPELRFSGFTDAWEQCKLGEIFEYLQNNTLSRDSLNYRIPNIKNIHYGDILVKFNEILDGSNKDIPYINPDLDLSKFSKSLLRDGDVIFSDTAEDDTVGKAIELQNVNAPFILSGLHTIPCRPLIPFGKGYLGNFFNSNSYRLQIRPLVQGIKVSSISKSALKDTMIEYPKNLDEQEKIGSLFQSITKMITLHQRKLDHLQLQKKALLQQMFV